MSGFSWVLIGSRRISLSPEPRRFCAQCGAALPPDAVSCPQCNRLVFAEELATLAAQAKTAESENDLRAARDLWAGALKLLPLESTQHATIAAHIDALDRAIEGSKSAEEE